MIKFLILLFQHKDNKQAGSSLIMAIMISTAIALAALYVNSSSESSVKNMGRKLADLFRGNLISELSAILSNPDTCTQSLAGVSLRGSTIDTNFPDIEIKTRLSDNTYPVLYSSSGTPEAALFKSIKILSIQLMMPSYTDGVDFPQGPGSQISYIRALGKNSFKTIRPIFKKIFVNFTTDSDGLSTIDSCNLIQVGLSGNNGWILGFDNLEVSAFQKVMVDTKDGPITLHLPHEPEHGDIVSFLDISGSFALAPVTVLSEPPTSIVNDGQSMSVDISGVSFSLVYESGNDSWRLF